MVCLIEAVHVCSCDSSLGEMAMNIWEQLGSATGMSTVPAPPENIAAKRSSKMAYPDPFHMPMGKTCLVERISVGSVVGTPL